jgi:hypothetical protein
LRKRNGQWWNGASESQTNRGKGAKSTARTARWATQHETEMRSEAEERQEGEREGGKKRFEDAWKSDV